jgi:two-component system response regulator FixJ
MSIQAGASSGPSRTIMHESEIFVVDDDENMRDLLTAILSLEGYPVTGFADGETFLRSASGRIPICLFLDIVMPGRSGMEILKELSARRYEAPIFLISGRGETPVVVDALKNGARDFLAKPFDPYTAVQRMRDAVDLWSTRVKKEAASELESLRLPGHVRLTRREAEVLAQIVRGVSSREISEALAIGKRTVDNFRMSIMRKLDAKNAADLVRIVMSLNR